MVDRAGMSQVFTSYELIHISMMIFRTNPEASTLLFRLDHRQNRLYLFIKPQSWHILDFSLVRSIHANWDSKLGSSCNFQ